jgi:hypothetical protein
MWYVICVLLGAVAGAAAVYFFARQTETEVIMVADTTLKERVENLHSVLFMGAGTVVSPFFDEMWGAAGLPEQGVPNIVDGRT